MADVDSVRPPDVRMRSLLQLCVFGAFFRYIGLYGMLMSKPSTII